ncbi:MAG: tetratricopeptide repeat protein [Elainellaceae cyanobacterium]
MTTPEFEPDSSLSPELVLERSTDPRPDHPLPSHVGSHLAGDRYSYEQGVKLVESGNYKEALAVLNRAVTLHSYDHLAWTLRGGVLVFLGQYDAAIASCDRALMIQPDHSEAWRFRGLALHGLNRYREAYASYDRALGIERRSPIEAIVHWVRQHLNKTDDTLQYPLDALLDSELAAN